MTPRTFVQVWRTTLDQRRVANWQTLTGHREPSPVWPPVYGSGMLDNPQILATLFMYQSYFISQPLDLIYWIVTIFIFDGMTLQTSHTTKFSWPVDDRVNRALLINRERGLHGGISNRGLGVLIQRAITRSIQIRQRQGFRCKNRTLEVNKVWIKCFSFSFFFYRPVIGPWALQENNVLDHPSECALYRLQTQAI